MGREVVIENGTKVQGSGHFKRLKGKVIDGKESSFGHCFALVQPKDGGEAVWARVTYLTERVSLKK